MAESYGVILMSHTVTGLSQASVCIITSEQTSVQLQLNVQYLMLSKGMLSKGMLSKGMLSKGLSEVKGHTLKGCPADNAVTCTPLHRSAMACTLTSVRLLMFQIPKKKCLKME